MPRNLIFTKEKGSCLGQQYEQFALPRNIKCRTPSFSLVIRIEDGLHYKEPGKYIVTAPTDCQSFFETVNSFVVKEMGLTGDFAFYFKWDGDVYTENTIDYNHILEFDKPIEIVFYQKPPVNKTISLFITNPAWQ